MRIPCIKTFKPVYPDRIHRPVASFKNVVLLIKWLPSGSPPSVQH